MCGNVGIAGKLETADENVMKRLLLFDFLRGPDSTGMAAIKKTGPPVVAKLASNPIDFFELPRFKAALNAFSAKAFIGHNRSATKGAVNTFNAHPYTFDHITGCHNGTLQLSSKTRLETMLDEKYDVDSQALMAAIARFGIEEVIPLMEGAWSLVWYNSQDDTLNFLRNKERPMWFAHTEDFGKLIWASEWPMINAAVELMLVPYKYHVEGENSYKFFSTPVDTWLKFDLGALAAGMTTKPKPKAKMLKGKEPAAVTQTGAYDPFGRSGAQGTTGGNTSPVLNKTGKTTTSRGSANIGIPKKTVVHLEGTDDDPLAGLLDRKAFIALAKDGCSFCQATVDYGDEGLLIFERDQIVLCPVCAETNGTTRIYTPSLEALL